MIKSAISTIYEQTSSVLEIVFSDNCEKILNLYKHYLYEKYEVQISIIIDDEPEEMLEKYIAFFVEDEKRFWSKLSENEMLSILEEDPAYQHLSFLSDIAFQQAKECYQKRKYYHNDEEYMLRLEELSMCLDKIKSYNIESAKELLSEAILDIDYVFGKSEAISLRLSRFI